MRLFTFTGPKETSLIPVQAIRSREKFAFALVLVVSAILRMLHLNWGLPSLLEEAMPLRVALRMIDPTTGNIDFNPHFFNYPTLSIYLHLLTVEVVYVIGHLFGAYSSSADLLLSFDIDPTPIVVASRFIHVGADIATVWAVFRIARHFSGLAAWIAVILTSFSSILLNTQRTIIVDTLEATLLAWSLERLFAWQATSAFRQLFTAAVLLGFAASAKYPAVVLVIPLLLAIYLHEPDRFPVLALTSLGLAGLSFLATSPYVLLNFSEALRDISFEGQHLVSGHFGSGGRPSLFFQFSSLLRTLGPLDILILCLSPILAFSASHRRLALQTLILFLLLVVPVISARHDAERYLAPTVPLISLLIGATAALLAERLKHRVGRPAQAIALTGILGPVIVAGFVTASSGFDATQRKALEWCERHLPRARSILQEGWSAPLVSMQMKSDAALGLTYQYASPRLRERFDSIRAYNTVSIPVRVTGTLAVGHGTETVLVPKQARFHRGSCHRRHGFHRHRFPP